MSFLNNFLKTKGHDAINGVITAMAAQDPDTATKAELLTREQDLDRAGAIIAGIRADLAKEQAEFDALDAQYHQMLGGADALKAQADAETDQNKKASLEASLDRLLGKVEAMVTNHDTKEKSLESTRALLNNANEAYKDKAKALASAKGELDQAKHELQHAKIDKERAAERADQAAAIAGLRESGTSRISVALDSMHAAAQRARAETEASMMKADALSSVVKNDDDDPNIIAALKAAQPQQGKQSVADRLNSLRR